MDFKIFSRLIMIEQTLFALPFAWIGVLFAGGGAIAQWFWVTIALFAARTAGMAYNRVLDSEIDAKNPRTSSRLIPSGMVSKTAVWIMAVFFSALLVFSSFMLNQLCFYLSFLAIFLLLTYSLFKRFSATSHFYLGVVEAAAPIGGYLGITGSIDLQGILPGLAILFWIAGLDIMYALQDMNHDRSHGLHSIPAYFGKKGSLAISGFCYLISLLILIAAGVMTGMGSPYYAGIGSVLFIFIRQQWIAWNTNDFIQGLKTVFALNRYISPVLLTGAALALIIS